jgi:hypothetical protein
LSAPACSGDKRPPSEPAPVAQPKPAPAAAPVPAAAEPQDPTPDELPLQEDFEPEAEQQIDEKNFKTELDAIEKEMNAEK